MKIFKDRFHNFNYRQLGLSVWNFFHRIWDCRNWTALATVILAIIGYFQYQTLNNQVNEQIAADRPWIAVQIQLNGPIKFNSDGSFSVSLWQVETNVGKTPASNVASSFEVIPATKAIEFNSTDEQKRECLEARKSQEEGINSGFLFPTDSYSGGESTSISRDQMYAPDVIPGNGSAGLIAVGCIDYIFPNGQGGQTSFAYDIAQKIPDDPAPDHVMSIDVNDGDVPESMLVITPNFFHSGSLK